MNFVSAKFIDECKIENKKQPALFTFFAGAGFLDLGFERAGFEIVFVNEFFSPFLKAYQYARENMGIAKPLFGHSCEDIADLLKPSRSADLALQVTQARVTNGVVGFVGGPPCPDFSVGGKNRGRDGENGKLSATYIELICNQLPDFFIFENVKGLWRTKLHRKFYEELKRKLNASGYTLTERLINSVEYGVPQDRDRIILVGVLASRLNSLEKETDSFPWKSDTVFEREILSADYWPQHEAFQIKGVKPKPKSIPSELTVEHWFNKNCVKQHPNADDCFTPRAALPKFERILEGDDSKKCFKRLHRWRYSPTAAYGNNEVHLHPYEARRISVSEAMAIQSLPAEFTLPPDMTLTDKFKTIGNGVPFLAAKGIAGAVLKYLEANKCLG
jgi:DNA (cytosine-5)-methyltransferase 1